MSKGNSGAVQVTIFDSDRLQAITELAQAINKLAAALTATPSVQVSDCLFSGPGGIVIDTALDTMEQSKATISFEEK